MLILSLMIQFGMIFLVPITALAQDSQDKFVVQKQHTFIPVVMWHGLGDDCCNELGMGKVKSWIEEEIPGAYVYSVQLSESATNDRFAGFYGNVDSQVSGNPHLP
ncbi:hypothetical protein BB560_000343 [Smittium megazygosporum]|uniref:Palmitoyl-protein thioesterase 1 n=1 Tax=Smittium megazygosporum TaxID=133381 RepID=A0A2T9ZKN8_9FUNG|nr:hypothetical protein BB560_000343 [Smittium megazygosporum]